MSKQNINELSAVSRFVEKFFDGLKNNTVDRMLKQAEKANVDPRIVSQMRRIKKETEEFNRLMAKHK